MANIDRLRQAGFSIADRLEPEYARVLNGLPNDQVNTLIRVRDKINTPDQLEAGDRATVQTVERQLDAAQTSRGGEPSWQERVAPL